jgi:hypothetical protein
MGIAEFILSLAEGLNPSYASMIKVNDGYR